MTESPKMSTSSILWLTIFILFDMSIGSIIPGSAFETLSSYCTNKDGNVYKKTFFLNQSDKVSFEIWLYLILFTQT